MSNSFAFRHVARRGVQALVSAALVLAATGVSPSAVASTSSVSISGSPPTSVVVRHRYAFAPKTSDKTRHRLRFSVDNRPSWASFSSSTGMLSGMPTKVGKFPNIVIHVSDGRSSASLKPFSISVTGTTGSTTTDQPPTIGGTPATTGVVGTAYSFQPAASDPDANTTLKFSIQGQPSWASFSTSSGALTGTPTAPGTFAGIVISVSDGTDTASLPAFTIQVKAASGSTSSAGAVDLSASTYSAQQTAGSVRATVNRAGGSSGAATVKYATANGTAVAGSDYTSTSGTLSWADGDATSKTISVPLGATAFTGSKTFTVALSGATGSTLGTPASATVTVVGSGVASTSGCSQSSTAWVTTGVFDSKEFGNYVVNNNNWGGTPNQKLWANDQNCWGVTTSATSEQDSVSSYPSVTRGWSQNGDIMQQLSSPGTQDWTTKSGMGVQVSAITKAQIHWAFTAPTTVPNRWLGLMDIYFHSTNSPSYTQFPPVVDLMIDQSIMDQPLSGQSTNTSTFYALTAQQDHATVVTLGGVKYVVYIDDSDEVAYHSSGGHTIHLFTAPTTFSDGSGPSWGTHDGRHDLKAIITFFMQANPKDDSGNALKFANGSTVTSALISSSLYLNAINAGWEIDVGTSFTNTAFCVAMQSEPDCP